MNRSILRKFCGLSGSFLQRSISPGCIFCRLVDGNMHLLLCLVVQVRVQFILFDLFRRKRMIVVDRAVPASAILLIQPDEAFRNTAQVSGTFI